jgi:hypothetical protein
MLVRNTSIGTPESLEAMRASGFRPPEWSMNWTGLKSFHLIVFAAIIGTFGAGFSSVAPTSTPSGIPVEQSTGMESIHGPLPVLGPMELYANIETVGIIIGGTALPKSAQLSYRREGESNWRSGHPLVRIDDGRLAGSLFNLIPSTTYQIKVTDGSAEIGGTITTQPQELGFSPSMILHVDDNAAAGGDGSASAPFRSIQEAVNRAGAGTQVLVADGIYRESITFPTSGASGNWIQVKAAGGAGILDGSDSLSGEIWSPLEGSRNVWYTKIDVPTAYLARDQKRFYMYDDFASLLEGRGHNKVPMDEGWYLAPHTTKLYIRSLDDPSRHTWQAPRFDQAFRVEGRDWIWIEGFEIQYYGTQDGCGICSKNSSHVVIRRNRIHNLQKGIYIEWTGAEEQGNDTRIEFNEIHDITTAEWPWNAVKGTSMEGTAIILRGHNGAIVRGNELHHFFNGIYTGSSAALENSGIAFDLDVYDNRIHHITDDGLEPEGACINQRFRDNLVDFAHVGISLAPVTQGPVWVLHSVFSNFSGRGIKWDRNSDGIALIYHNTFWTESRTASGMDFISPAYNATLRNNIFQENALGFDASPIGSTGQDWNYDNWFTSRDASSVRFRWQGVNYLSLAQLCSAAGLECNGHDQPPGLVNPRAGDFSLQSNSNNIDRGVIVPGINDGFMGRAPDIGVFEFTSGTIPVVKSITRVGANPSDAASVDFLVSFSEPVSGVDLTPPFSDFVLQSTPQITGSVISGIVAESQSAYRVSVNVGSGNGDLRLDVVDDNSIVNGSGVSLGGPAVGDGSFGSGELYSINRILPVVVSVSRADPSPAESQTVRFQVAFSQEVTGVDAGDFLLSAGGALSGAKVNEISGSGTAYVVTLDTGTGDGTLRLDVVDDDSIVNASNTPLLGAGYGNGDFSGGETYTIDKNPPFVVSSTRMDADNTSSDVLRFAVGFSESVSGIDAADFALTTSGSLSGATVSGVSETPGTGGSGYIVTVKTGTGNGTLRLDVLDDDSILDQAGRTLGGPGAGSGGFTSGESYSIIRLNVVRSAEAFRSSGVNDGWVLESSEDSSQGGSKNALSATFNLGDDGQDRQYRSILHFPTSSLPDNAVISMAILMIKRQGLSGEDPFLTHGNILVDIRDGYFGTPGLFGINSLDSADFQSPASQNSVGVIFNNPVNGWYWTLLDGSAFKYINRAGVTQFRLSFEKDDNDDRGADYLRFFSGNHASQSNRPILKVEYFLP